MAGIAAHAVTDEDVATAAEILQLPEAPPGTIAAKFMERFAHRLRQALEEFSQRRTAGTAPDRKPTKLERTEAAHWVRTARESLGGFGTALENFTTLPEISCQLAEQDIDSAIRNLERARSALRGRLVGALPGMRGEKR